MKNHLVLIIGAVLVLGLTGFIMFIDTSPEGDTGVETDASMDTSHNDEDTGSEVRASADASGNNLHRITLATNFGDITFETYDADAPKTVENFTTLARDGYYDSITFHRVIEGFMIQGGDPLGTGMGGPGYTFEDELDPETASYQAGYQKGVVAMANAGPNTNGSQFFIMLEDYPLPNSYTIFGKVTNGQDVVDAIGVVETNDTDKPLEAVTIESVSIEQL